MAPPQGAYVIKAISIQVVVRATISGASSQSLCYQGYFNPGGCESYKQWPLLKEPVLSRLFQSRWLCELQTVAPPHRACVIKAISIQVVVRATNSGPSSRSLCYQGYFNPGGCVSYNQWCLLTEPVLSRLFQSRWLCELQTVAPPQGACVIKAISIQVVVRATNSGPSSQSLCYQGHFNLGGCESYNQWCLLTEPVLSRLFQSRWL